MKPEEHFIYRFGLYELLNYIYAKRQLPDLEEEYKELEERFYDEAPMTMTTADYDLGKIVSGGFNLDDYVIHMIEKKDYFLKKLNRLRKQEELFDMAMNTLTPRERDVIRVRYFNHENDLGLSLEFFQEVLTEAQDKLCSFIGEENMRQRKEMEERRQAQREQLKNDVKSGRVRVV